MLLAPCPPHTPSTSPQSPLHLWRPSFPSAVGLTAYVLSTPFGHAGPDSSDFCHSELRRRDCQQPPPYSTPPAIRPLSTSGGGFEWLPQTLQRHKAYSGFAIAERDRFSKRCKGYCMWANAESWRRDVRCAAELGSVSVFGDLLRE